MLHIVWEFYARPERLREFQQHYGSDGDWAQLFSKSSGYNRTTVVRDMKDPGRFIVTDIWNDLASFESFKQRFKDEYDALDKKCEQLTSLETCIGYFESL